MNNVIRFALISMALSSFGASANYAPDECEIISNPACIPAGGGHNPYERPSSPNGYPTEIIFINSGGYNARFSVEYKNGPDGRFVDLRSNSLPSGQKYKVTVPANALYLHLKAERHTGFEWREIFTFNVDVVNNDRTYISKNLNVMEFKVWGTTLAPKWNELEAKDTYYNGGSF